MTKYSKQLLSVLATGAVLLNLVAPVAATGSGIEITGNGADSSNNVTVGTNQTNTVVQTNTAVVTNTIHSTSTTGGNDANKNTGGSTTIGTGDAKSSVSVSNMLNSNQATINCCQAGDVAVKVDGNGAGSGSEYGSPSFFGFGGYGGSNSGNNVTVHTDTTNSVEQTNTAAVTNTVDAKAKTGYNDANKNTGGDVTVNSGDATSGVQVATNANMNVATLGSTQPSDLLGSGGVSALLAGNGSDSNNHVSVKLANDTSVFQTNAADVNNNVNTDASTGKNDANKNTGGDVVINEGLGGMATAVAVVKNNLNANVADINCCSNLDLTAVIKDNGADSYNKVSFNLKNDRNIVQDNAADVSNMVYADATTGKNHANENTGGNVSVNSGDALVGAQVDNMLNFNWASGDCCAFDLFGKIAGNGADATNKIKVYRDNTAGTWQTNGAEVSNPVYADGSTGKNDANQNTGNPTGDPSVSTGDSTSTTIVSTAANLNGEGSAPSLFPTVELGVDWAQVMALFHLGH